MAKIIQNKKLTKSNKNSVIAGVCGGLGEYFGIDPTILRIIFVILTVFGGGGLIIYLVLWIVMPKSSSEDRSEDYIKDNVEEIKTRSKEIVGGDGKTVAGIILIVLGLSFLLENLGVFAFRFIWKLWPVIIILVGISMLSRNKK